MPWRIVLSLGGRLIGPLKEVAISAGKEWPAMVRSFFFHSCTSCRLRALTQYESAVVCARQFSQYTPESCRRFAQPDVDFLFQCSDESALICRRRGEDVWNAYLSFEPNRIYFARVWKHNATSRALDDSRQTTSLFPCPLFRGGSLEASLYLPVMFEMRLVLLSERLELFVLSVRAPASWAPAVHGSRSGKG